MKSTLEFTTFFHRIQTQKASFIKVTNSILATDYTNDDYDDEDDNSDDDDVVMMMEMYSLGVLQRCERADAGIHKHPTNYLIMQQKNRKKEEELRIHLPI